MLKYSARYGKIVKISMCMGENMKESRQLLRNAGFPLYRLIIAFALIRDYIMFPIMSFIWANTLKTTPDGFISNANIGITLLKSPWIILIGLILIGIFLLFSMWQVSATIFGVAYAYEGKRVRVRDLLRISFNDTLHGVKPKNWMLILYTAIILPLTNVFQACEMIGAFVVPEYIQDFIYSKLSLSILYLFVVIIATYFAFRWFYVLPAFFLKSHDFKKSSEESFSYTKKGGLKTWIRLIIYGLIESVRLVAVPFVIMLCLLTIAYIMVEGKAYASDLFSFMAIDFGAEAINALCGVMVYLSGMCFVVNEYYSQIKHFNCENDIHLPELTVEIEKRTSGRKILIISSLIGSLIIAGSYLILVFGAQFDSSLLLNLMPNPEVIAHKGYSSMAPENTMDAFELADKTKNADLIELDVWSSKDGIPVVIHNETIKAATGLEGKIYDYTYEELQQIPAPYTYGVDSFPDARIPSLEEVLSNYSTSTPILIEIKGYKQDRELPAKIVALMEKYHCTESSKIHSGDYGALKAVKECNSQIECGLIQAIVTGNCYDLPYADFLSVEHSFVTNNMLNQLHKRGKKLYVWTVNYESSVNPLVSMDVDGIITDYPDDIAVAVKSEISLFDSLTNSVLEDEKDPERAIEEFEAGNY